MFKNVASQTLTLYAVDASTGLPKSGDAANMVFYVSKDDGTVTAVAGNSGVPTEIDSTNAKGLYKIALTQSETNGDKLLFSGKSSTSNVVVVPAVVYTTPANFSALSLGSNGHVTNVDTLTTYTSNTPQTGDAFALVGTAGAGLTALGDSRIANLDAAISTRGTSTLTQTQVTGGAYSVQSSSCVLGDARVAHLDADVSSRMATYTQPTGFLASTFPTTVASTTNITAAAGCAVSSIGGGVITAASIAADAITAAKIADGAIDTATFASGTTIPRCTLTDTATTVTNQLTAAAIATGVWQDSTSGDFTASGSIGKSLFTSGNAPGAASGLALVGSNVGTATSVSGAVGSVTGNVGGNVVGSVASVTARVTANADQLAGQIVTAGAGVTFPASVASPTNITAGTITTVTTLTNPVTLADGVAHGGSTATLRLGSSSGYALTVQSSASSYAGAFFGGGTSGAGVYGLGGAGAPGAWFAGGSNGDGLKLTGAGSGHDLNCTGDGLLFGTVTAATNVDTVGGQALVQTGGKLWVLDGSGNAVAPSSTALSTVTWTNTRAGYLDNLSGGAVMLAGSYTAPLSAAGTRSAVGLTTADLDAQLAALDADILTRASGTTALSTAQWTNGRAALLDNLDAAVSTRSTYAGADTSGTTTIMARLTASRAGYLDNLSAGAVALAGSAPSWYSTSVTVSAMNANVITASSIATGAITDAKIAVPTETAGAPTGILGMIAWLASRLGLRRVKNNRTAKTVTTYMANGTSVLTTQSYSASTSTVDDLGAAT